MYGNEPVKGELLFHQTSVKVLEDRTIVTAPAGRGVFRTGQNGEWIALAEGMPPKTHVNRLQSMDGTLYACTDKGMFKLEEEVWQPMDMPMICYQYKETGHAAFAATSHGLWCKTAKGWKSTAFPHAAVYDFLYTPHYIFLAMDWGIAMYDRLTCTWERFVLNSRITGLAVFDGRLLGVTDRGGWVLGNKKGNFDKVRFPGMYIFNVAMRERSVYVCADRGLYRLNMIGKQPALLSVCIGCPVTDLDIRDDCLYVATLSEGVQTIDMR